MFKIINKQKGFTLIEVMVVLILLTLSFMVFLRALNTGKSVRANSELRTVQGVILNSIQNEIRARRFDENISLPWSLHWEKIQTKIYLSSSMILMTFANIPFLQ